MKRNHKLLLLLLLSCLLPLVLIGCGGSKTETAATAVPAATEAHAAQASSVNITFDYNYENAPDAQTMQVAYDDVASEPDAPREKTSSSLAGLPMLPAQARQTLNMA